MKKIVMLAPKLFGRAEGRRVIDCRKAKHFFPLPRRRCRFVSRGRNSVFLAWIFFRSALSSKITTTRVHVWPIDGTQSRSECHRFWPFWGVSRKERRKIRRGSRKRKRSHWPVSRPRVNCWDWQTGSATWKFRRSDLPVPLHVDSCRSMFIFKTREHPNKPKKNILVIPVTYMPSIITS